jgi:hypothetical protein
VRDRGEARQRQGGRSGGDGAGQHTLSSGFSVSSLPNAQVQLRTEEIKPRRSRGKSPDRSSAATPRYAAT